MDLLLRCLIPIFSLSLVACKDKGEELPAGRFSAVGALTADDAGLYVVGGATSTAASGPLDDAWRYDLDGDSWSPLPDLPSPSLRGVATVRDGQLTIFGGSTTGWTDHAWLWSLDDNGEAWEDHGEEGPEARFKHAATSHDGMLYLTGGRNNDGETEVIYGDLWMLDLDAMTWAEMLDVDGPAGIHRHAMVYDPEGTLLWVHGGFQPPADDPEGEPVRSDRLWALYPATGAWVEQTWTGEGPPARASHALFLVDGKPHVWGGNAGDDSTWSFDPDTSTWTEHAHEVAPLPRDAFVSDLTADGSSLWLAGGDPVSEEVPDFVMDVWRLDVPTMTWTEVRGVQ